MAKMPETIEFDVRVHGIPTGYRLVPIEPPPSLAPLLTGYSLDERHGWSERDRAGIVAHLRTRWAAILAALPASLPPVSLGVAVPRPVAYHDKDQPAGIAWCPGYPHGLKDITPLYAAGVMGTQGGNDGR